MWAPEPVWTFWREDKYRAQASIQISEYPARSLVTITFRYQPLSTLPYFHVEDIEIAVSRNLKFIIPHSQVVLNIIYYQ
jgi:hypothetical protein